MATHSSILAWISPQTEEPGRLQSIGSQRVRYGWSDLAYIPLKDFPGGSVVKTSPANAGDTGYAGSIPGLGRCPGEGNGNSL